MNPPLPYNWLNRAWIGFYGQKYDFDSLSSLSWAFMCHSCDCRTEMTALQLNALLSALLKGVKVGTWSLSSHLPPGPQHHGGCSIPVRVGCEEVTKHHKSTSHRIRGKQSPAVKLHLKKKKYRHFPSLNHWHLACCPVTLWSACFDGYSTCCMCCVKKQSVESIELTGAGRSGPGSFTITAKSFPS